MQSWYKITGLLALLAACASAQTADIIVAENEQLGDGNWAATVNYANGLEGYSIKFSVNQGTSKTGFAFCPLWARHCPPGPGTAFDYPFFWGAGESLDYRVNARVPTRADVVVYRIGYYQVSPTFHM